MPAIGKENFLVKLLHLKTKIRPDDIVDIIKALPECMAEAFFQENPAEKQPVNFGPISMRWRNTNLGPGTVFTPSQAFQKEISRVKYEQKTPLAALLFEKTLPIIKERIIQSIEKPVKYIRPDKPKDDTKQHVYAEKAKENRINRKKKRKKQAILLKAIK